MSAPTEPQSFDWPAALDAFGAGHTLDACRRVRDLLDAAGVPQPPLHVIEQSQVAELRQQAAARLAQADGLERRAPRTTDNPVNSYADVRVKAVGSGGELQCTADGCRWHAIADEDNGLVWHRVKKIVAAATHRCPHPAASA